MRFGLILPHFGADVRVDRLVSIARRAEELGFASLWVRDRLGVAAPHGLVMEAGGTRFLEPLLTLAALSTVTRTIMLGTAVLIPIRHPAKLVQDIGTLSYLCGGRLILGVGLGVGQHNFRPLGFGVEDREELFEETMAVLKQALSGYERLHFSGRHFSFTGLAVDPAPPRELTLWYGGTSYAAVRRAFQHAHGWVAGRLPLVVFERRMQLVRKLSEVHGRSVEVATIPITVIHRDEARARERAHRAVDILAHSAEGSATWFGHGRSAAIEDLAGMLIAGSPTTCVKEVQRLAAIGVGHIIFDLRLAFDWFEESLELLGREVIPEVLANRELG